MSPKRHALLWGLAALGVPVVGAALLWVWGVSEEATRGTAGGATQGPSLTLMLTPSVVAVVAGAVVLGGVTRPVRPRWLGAGLALVALLLAVGLGAAAALVVTGGQLYVPGPLPPSP